MALGTRDHDSTKIFNASVTAVNEVTDNANSLIYSISIFNGTANDAYLQVFDADADDVTLDITTPTFVLGVPADKAMHFEFPKPIRFTTGFSVASTATRTGDTIVTQEVTISYMDRA